MPDGAEWIVRTRELLETAAQDKGSDWVEQPKNGIRFRVTGGFRLLEDHLVPNVVELASLEDVAADPQIYARIEMTNAGPQLRELRYYCVDPDSRGIQQSHLRDTQVRYLLEDFVGRFMIGVEIDEDERSAVLHPVSRHDDSFVDARRFAGRLRAGKTARDITPQLLERVAHVYRENVDRHPTKAVQHHFQVSQRMAAEYVSRARKRGLLPPTTRGKKQA